MKLRKMITVSAAALMLAGVGASSTNAVPNANASRKTVRVAHLRGQKLRLTRQIRRDQGQVNRLNREIARLSHKTVRRGKRSKKVTNRRKSAKKRVTKRRKNVKRQNKRQPKLTTRKMHIGMHNNVYTAEVVSNGKVGRIVPQSVKYVSSMKSYAKKYTKPFLKDRAAIQSNLAMFKKTHNAKYYMNAAKASQELNQIGVMPVSNSAKK